MPVSSSFGYILLPSVLMPMERFSLSTWLQEGQAKCSGGIAKEGGVGSKAVHIVNNGVVKHS